MFSYLIGFLAGVVLVEAVSYFWHRFAEHGSVFGRTISYRHFVHHEENYPVENLRPVAVTKYKTVHPWSWWLAASVVCVVLFLIAPLKFAFAIFAGGLCHGAFIVKLHETFHIENHWLNRFSWYCLLVKRHDIHHWAQSNYGIAFFWMDRLFGTLRDKAPQEREVNFPAMVM